VYVTQPPSFEIKGKEDMVYKLKNAIYGLKHAPRAWNKRINSFLLQLKFQRCIVEHGVYVRVQHERSNLLLVCLYVDDLLITSSSSNEIEEFKKVMKAKFEMRNLGKLSYFLGMEFTITSKGMVLHQKKYGSEEKVVDVTFFKQIVGSLRYLCNSRLDICYGVGLISRFMDGPRKQRMVDAKRIMRYLQGTLEFGVLFPNKMQQEKSMLIGYSNSYWFEDKVDRRSTTRYVFKFLNAHIS